MSHDLPEIPESEKSLWEKAGTIRIIWIVLLASCVFFGGYGFVLAAQHKIHGHFGFDAFPLFYAGMGFVCFSFIVLAGQHLRKIIMRPEDYYERNDPDAPRSTPAGDEGADA